MKKVLKGLGVAAAALLVLFLGVAALLPGSYTVERTIEIAASPALVYEQVIDYNTWLEWSPWPKMDPSAKQTVTGTPGTIGMTWSWIGEELGSGQMTIVALEPNRSLHSRLEFKAPMQGFADDYVELEPTENGGTRVTWRNTGELPFPLGRYFGLGVEGMLGPQYEDGLQSLEKWCESLTPSSTSLMPSGAAH